MAEFDKVRFKQMLREVPEQQSLFGPAEHSEYLQENVFDKLNCGETVDLQNLDFDAFTLQQVIPEGYDRQHDAVENEWVKGLNYMLRKTRAAAVGQRAFF